MEKKSKNIGLNSVIGMLDGHRGMYYAFDTDYHIIIFMSCDQSHSIMLVELIVYDITRCKNDMGLKKNDITLKTVNKFFLATTEQRNSILN